MLHQPTIGPDDLVGYSHSLSVANISLRNMLYACLACRLSSSCCWVIPTYNSTARRMRYTQCITICTQDNAHATQHANSGESFFLRCLLQAFHAHVQLSLHGGAAAHGLLSAVVHMPYAVGHDDFFETSNIGREEIMILPTRRSPQAPLKATDPMIVQLVTSTAHRKNPLGYHM